MPARRPRRASGMDWFHIVPRNKPLTMSPAPAITSPSDRHRERRCEPEHDDPEPPHAGREGDGPPVTPDPAYPAACERHEQRAQRRRSVENPSTPAPPKWRGDLGNSAVGIPKNMAFMSTRYEPSRSLRLLA